MEMGATILSAAMVHVAALAEVQCRSALSAYREIFPADAPKPTPAKLAAGWEAAIAGGHALLAKADETVIGGVIARDSELSRLYVAPDWWSRGVGTQLYKAAVSRLRSRGYTKASLWVLDGNRRARAMYERWGWIQVPGESKDVWPGVTEVRYRLAL